VAVRGEVDVMLVYPVEAVEYEICVGLDAHHVVECLLVEVLDDQQELVAYCDLFANL
jgi:hypothetical protein